MLKLHRNVAGRHQSNTSLSGREPRFVAVLVFSTPALREYVIRYINYYSYAYDSSLKVSGRNKISSNQNCCASRRTNLGRASSIGEQSSMSDQFLSSWRSRSIKNLPEKIFDVMQILLTRTRRSLETLQRKSSNKRKSWRSEKRTKNKQAMKNLSKKQKNNEILFCDGDDLSLLSTRRNGGYKSAMKNSWRAGNSLKLDRPTIFRGRASALALCACRCFRARRQRAPGYRGSVLTGQFAAHCRIYESHLGEEIARDQNSAGRDSDCRNPNGIAKLNPVRNSSVRRVLVALSPSACRRGHGYPIDCLVITIERASFAITGDILPGEGQQRTTGLQDMMFNRLNA